MTTMTTSRADATASLHGPEPTPLLPMQRLARHLGLPADVLFVKRDDITPLAGGGSKSRKLARICAQAIAEGADWLITVGGPQSNHARMAAAAARRCGLGCSLILWGADLARPSGNLLLDTLLADEVLVGDPEAEVEAVAAVVARLRERGHRPFVIPTGGATPTGVAAMVDAARELDHQLRGQRPLSVVASGSGGLHAGLVVGAGDHDRVLGIRVGTAPGLEAQIVDLCTRTAAELGLAQPRGAPVLDSRHSGPTYGSHTDAAREAILLTGRLEGLLLDPVYSGKAMAGLVAGAREGSLPLDRPIVFWLTGGWPALLARDHACWIADTAPGAL